MEQPCCCPRCDDCVELHDMRECDECRMLMCKSCVKPMGCDYLCERCSVRALMADLKRTGNADRDERQTSNLTDKGLD